jgi:acetyl esterase/lipase
MSQANRAIVLSQVAPELRGYVRWMPQTPIAKPLGRRIIRALLGLYPAVKVAGASMEAVRTAQASVRVFRPDVRRTAAALLWMHGGGYMIGGAVQDDAFCGETCRRLGMVVVSVEYRLAPEHPFPAPLDDCFAAWEWLQRSAVELGVDPQRVVIGGQSAGGGLAAGLVQRVHDTPGANASGQWLFCPMLDDRTAAERGLDDTAHLLWDNRLNAAGWSAYLGRQPGAPDVPDYAAPARRVDLLGLPPTWIGVGGIDLFHAECVDYALRLRAAGVDCTLDCVPGAPHAFEAWGRRTELAGSYLARARDWLAERV